MSMDLPLIDRLPDVTPALDKSVGLPSSNIACTVDAPGDSTVSINDTESNNIPLVSEHAVLSCMAYVDLNPVRAAMAPTPEESDHTSIQLRIEYWKNKSEQLQGKGTIDDDENLQPESLMPFAGNPRQPMPPGIAFNLLDYIELLDWTGRQIRDNKRGSIDTTIPSALTRLDISQNHWLELCTHFEDRFKGLVGSQHSLNNMVAAFGLTRKANRSALLFC